MKQHLEGAGFLRIVGLALGVMLLVSISAESLHGSSGDSAKTRLASSRAPNAYVLARRDHWTSSTTSIEELERLHRRLSGDFLWFRRDGRAYLVRDRATLAEAFGLFDPMEELQPEMAELGRRQKEIDRKQAVLDREEEELDRIADRLDDDEEGRRESERRDLERRQRDLESRARRLEEAERKLEAVERSIDEREEALEKKAEEQLFELMDRTLREGIAAPEGR
jgi:DNA repair exonuclease SbcCD ATPase subunit